MRRRDILICFLLLTFCFSLIAPAYGASSLKSMIQGDEPPVTERIIKIEGSIEKPRVIFIIPRAKLWRDDIFKKSFISDILRPVHSRLLIREEGIDKTIRR